VAVAVVEAVVVVTAAAAVAVDATKFALPSDYQTARRLLN